jgi:hypothetical protein
LRNPRTGTHTRHLNAQFDSAQVLFIAYFLSKYAGAEVSKKNQAYAGSHRLRGASAI